MKRVLSPLGILVAICLSYTAFAGDDGACLSCHSKQGMSLKLSNGEELSLTVDKEMFNKSVHGQMLGCTDCHNISLSEHPTGKFKFASRREYTLAMYETCKQCHFSNYTKMLESVHYDLLSKGNRKAPICVDCHGYHNVEPPNRSRIAISRNCAKCHRKVYEVYAGSVHGRALIEEHNNDVPVCSDCHKSHNIKDPRTAAFLVNTPEICGNCHANEKLMAKYGLSTDVLKTYLNDFHGVSTKAYQKQGDMANVALKALCIDCHGVHDIMKTKSIGGAGMKSELLKKCQKCHEGATPNFPESWMSHYEPSLTKAPLVWAVKIFYKFVIPFIILGLLLHIVLHIWRLIVNR